LPIDYRVLTAGACRVFACCGVLLLLGAHCCCNTHQPLAPWPASAEAGTVPAVSPNTCTALYCTVMRCTILYCVLESTQRHATRLCMGLSAQVAPLCTWVRAENRMPCCCRCCLTRIYMDGAWTKLCHRLAPGTTAPSVECSGGATCTLMHTTVGLVETQQVCRNYRWLRHCGLTI
jgi:hypothetical protein